MTTDWTDAEIEEAIARVEAGDSNDEHIDVLTDIVLALQGQRRRLPLVVCLRDPDASNDFSIFGGEARIYDIDAGYQDLRDPAEYAEWREAHHEAADRVAADGYPEAADFIRGIVAQYGQDA